MKKIILILLWVLPAKSFCQQFEWAKQLGTATADMGFTVKTDAQGNVYTGGYFTGAADFDPGPGVFTMNASGSQDAFVSKLDPNGNFIWAKQFGGPGSGDAAVCYSLFIDGPGNIYLTGNFDGRVDFDPGPGQFNLQLVNLSNTREIFVVKLNPSGNFVWARHFGGPGSLGGFSSSICVDVAGNVYTTGFFSGLVDFDPGPLIMNLNTGSIGIQSSFISKLTAAGDLAWVKQIGDMRANCWSFGLALDNAGNICLAGAFGASISTIGTVDFDPGPGLHELTVPAANTNAFIAQLDLSGNFQAVTAVDQATNEYARSIAIDGNNNIYFSGYNSNNNSDVFVGKIGSPGNSSWIKSMGDNGHEESHSISTDANGNIYVAGFFEQTVDFDAGPGVNNLSSSGDADIFLVKIDASGNLSWAKNAGGTGIDAGYAVATDSQGNVYATGMFIGQPDMDPGPGSFVLNSNGSADAFTLKLARCATTSSTIDKTICAGQTFLGYSSAGTYRDTLINSNGCDSVRTIHLTMEALASPKLGPDVNLCAGDSLVLSPGTFTSYSWQDGSSQDHLVVKKAGIYSVLVQNNCGPASDQVIVTEKDCAVYFPSGFSPNNDGKNDQFRVLTNYNLIEFRLSVYNRWGENIFTTKDPSKGWDGKLMGQPADTGIFAWYCEYRKPGDSKLYTGKGTVSLIR